MVILCQGQFWRRCVCIYGAVVTEDVHWTANWELKQLQLVAKGIYDFYYILHCSELRLRCRCFHQVLPHAEPNDWCLVAEQKDSSLRPSCLGVPSMVFKNKTVFLHEITSRHWLVPWDRFTGILIKLLQVTILKTVLIYGRLRWVKIQFPLWVRLQVPKYDKGAQCVAWKVNFKK